MTRRSRNDDITGTYVSASTSDPSTATQTVNAIGVNIRPSSPWSEKIGTYTAMMIATPKTMGRPTSKAAARKSDCRSLSAMRTRVFETPDEVLHHDDGRVDKESEVERAEAHQIRRDAELLHGQGGKQQRQRDHGRRDERRADVAQEQEEDQGHEQSALRKVR